MRASFWNVDSMNWLYSLMQSQNIHNDIMKIFAMLGSNLVTCNYVTIELENKDRLYFKVSLLQCNYTFKYGVILIKYMYLLYS